MIFFTRGLALFVLAMVACSCAPAQKLTLDEPHAKTQVIYIPEPVTVEAGKPADVELNFRVLGALHINSHEPSDSEMIPTTLTLHSAPDVKVGRVWYPPGTKYAFSFAPHEKLSVYSGDFMVNVSMTAMHAGSYTLSGELRYQACDNLKCYPLQTLPVIVLLTAK